MPKKKICWITPDWFVDVDIPIVPHLLNEYDITWIIFFPWRNNRFKEEDLNDFQGLKNLHIKFFHNPYYGLDPRCLITFNKIKHVIEDVEPDLIYFNFVPADPMVLPLYRWLPADKTIVTAHDGCVKPTFKFRHLAEYSFNKGYNPKRYVQFFSKEQARIFDNERPGKQLFVIPLALKDFGKATKPLRTDCVSFVSFGRINEDKNVKLLIKAAEKIYDEGYRNFKVVVKGTCPAWKQEYEPLIKHPELYEADIRFIDNSEIANIYTENTYGVFPYKQTGQSGAIKAALFYREPTIVSNLPGFTDDITDGYNGYVFKSEDVEDLARVMKHCIDTYPEEYNKIVKNVEQFVDTKYSEENIMGMYRSMFQKVLNHE